MDLVEWNGCETLGFTLNDGQSCKTLYTEFNNSYIFHPNKKITRVEVFIHKDENFFVQIIFSSYGEILVEIGRFDNLHAY